MGEWPLVDALDAELSPSFLGTRIIPAPKLRKLAASSQITAAPPLQSRRVAQETQLIVDALRLLSGGEGDHVQFADSYFPQIWDDRVHGPEYWFDPAIEPGLRAIMQRVATLARHRSAVIAFSGLYMAREHGRVNHALCATFRTLIAEFDQQVSRIAAEFGRDTEFSLLKLGLLLQKYEEQLHDAYLVVETLVRRRDGVSEAVPRSPAAETSDESQDIVRESEVAQSNSPDFENRGGTILRHLAELERLHNADRDTKRFLSKLLSEASKPYLEMLAQWIWRGEIMDPYDEFMVTDRPPLSGMSGEIAWAERYAIRTDELPLQLSMQRLWLKVASAGKYLDVLRRCGSDSQSSLPPMPDPLPQFTSVEDPKLVLAVENAWKRANSAVINLLRTQCRLSDWMRSLRHFFLLQDTDYLVSFLNFAEGELSKPAAAASILRMQLRLDSIVSSSGCSSSAPFGSEFKIELAPVALSDALIAISETTTKEVPRAIANRQLRAAQALQLDVDVPFPVSMVVSRTTLTRYQFLFRHLVELAWSERLLENAWLQQMQLPQWRQTSSDAAIQAAKQRAQLLRSRMALYVTALLQHSAGDVLASDVNQIARHVEEAEDLDALVNEHLQFLSQALRKCFLTSKETIALQARIAELARRYARFLIDMDDNLAWIEWGDLPENKRPPIEPVCTGKEGELYEPKELLAWFEDTTIAYEDWFVSAVRRLIGLIKVDEAYSIARTLAVRLEGILE